jgi:hypothetical protein
MSKIVMVFLEVDGMDRERWFRNSEITGGYPSET